MVARDWRGGKVFYREWSKLGVERTLGALNGEGSWEELAPEYWKTSRRAHPRFAKAAKHGPPPKKNHLGVLWSGHPPGKILRYAQDDTDWNGTDGGVGGDSSGSRLARRTWGMVARDWRGGKVFYREWSKLGVERTLGALNGEGSWEELAPEYWKTSRLAPFPKLSQRVKGCSPARPISFPKITVKITSSITLRSA